MKARKAYLDGAQRQWVRDWWRALQPREPDSAALPDELAGLKRGDRAALRRCGNADALLQVAATYRLSSQLIALESSKAWPRLADTAICHEWLAVVAGVLAHVNDSPEDGRTLAWHLGNAAGNERPLMSEMRFKRLQRAQAVDDIHLQCQRAVQLANNRTDVAQLADDLLARLIEQDRPAARASDSVKFRWAYDYYLTMRQQAAASNFPEEKTA